MAKKKKIILMDYDRYTSHLRDHWKARYFKFDIEFLNGNGIYSLSSDAKILYYFIVLQAMSYKNKEILLDISAINSQLNIFSEIKGLLTELKDNNLIGFSLRLGRTNILTNSLINIPEFDFESVYKIYPRKKGKKKGMDKLKGLIKNQADFDALVIGVTNFAKEVRVNKTDETYIPYFSTFVNAESWKECQVEIKTTEDKLTELFSTPKGTNNV